MVEEHQIAREQGPGRLVEHGEIAVAVRRRPRPQGQGSRAEIERRVCVDQERRRDEPHHDLINSSPKMRGETSRCRTARARASARGKLPWPTKVVPSLRNAALPKT